MYSAFSNPHAGLPQRLYLTGFMGSGKSTTARRLAHRLGWVYVDLDRLTAVLAGRALADLFAEGEAAFRAAERDTLARTFDRAQIVVATGGGTLVDAGAMAAARTAGCVVYLRLPAATLAARLEADETFRPLLQGPDGPLRGTALRTRVEALMAERAPRYEQADVVVDAEGLTPAEVTEAIHAALRRLDAP